VKVSGKTMKEKFPPAGRESADAAAAREAPAPRFWAARCRSATWRRWPLLSGPPQRCLAPLRFVLLPGALPRACSAPRTQFLFRPERAMSLCPHLPPLRRSRGHRDRDSAGPRVVLRRQGISWGRRGPGGRSGGRLSGEGP
jgi:hypothetical protein